MLSVPALLKLKHASPFQFCCIVSLSNCNYFLRLIRGNVLRNYHVSLHVTQAREREGKKEGKAISDVIERNVLLVESQTKDERK